MIKLSGLSPCYTQHSILTVLYVVCYQSVTRNANNISGYVYNSEFITQPTPIIATFPRQTQILNLTVCFSLSKFKLMFLVVLSKIFY